MRRKRHTSSSNTDCLSFTWTKICMNLFLSLGLRDLWNPRHFSYIVFTNGSWMFKLYKSRFDLVKKYFLIFTAKIQIIFFCYQQNDGYDFWLEILLFQKFKIQTWFLCPYTFGSVGSVYLWVLIFVCFLSLTFYGFYIFIRLSLYLFNIQSRSCFLI